MTLKKRLARAFRALTAPEKTKHAPVYQPVQDISRYYYLGPELALTRLKNGHFLYIDPADEAVSANMIAYGAWEHWVYTLVMSLMEPGHRIVEVGANIGYYTIAMAAAVGPTGSVTAFDANPRLTSLVRKSSYINGFPERITLIQKAASDQAGVLQFDTSRQNSGGGYVSLGGGHTAYNDSVLLDVEATTLDAEISGQVDFIRIDAEGSEAFILRGAARILQDNPNIVICMEWDVIQIGSRTSVAAFVEWMSGLGFRYWRIGYDSKLAELSPSDLATLDRCDIVAARNLPQQQGLMAAPIAASGETERQTHQNL